MKRLPVIFSLALSLSLTVACGDDGGDGGTPDAAQEPDANLQDPPPPALGAQVDRAGRPAISSALIETFNPDDAIRNAARDAYNANGDPAAWATDHFAQIKSHVAILDALDTAGAPGSGCGNALADLELAGGEARYEVLSTVLVDDQLYVDSAQGTCGGAYLAVEANAALGAGIADCGGRTPSADVIETSYSALAAGLLAGVDDTIAADDIGFDEDTFPFLNPAQN